MNERRGATTWVGLPTKREVRLAAGSATARRPEVGRGVGRGAER
ncbi:hypothetical protein ACFO0N_02505 [Halobium salinum]|uniref:Uncharacterized protein n=1 Tax=Halobium salinum TaxID=1364940 RepID=A0ABD5P7F0_9EURY|nr:hypothetical protein [Halobium salinum]